MSEEQIKKELEKASGNNRMEGHNITKDEENLILEIFQKYKGNYGEKAIDSLLYGIVQEVEDMQGEKTYGKYQK